MCDKYICSFKLQNSSAFCFGEAIIKHDPLDEMDSNNQYVGKTHLKSGEVFRVGLCVGN